MTRYEKEKMITEIITKFDEQKTKEIDTIINKIFEYPIALSDKHYNFLKEIEKELREFKIRYC